jgi:SAM-dependent methyltransferase
VFKDHFSGHAAQYAKFRPVYPDELFDWLAREAPARARAVDAATGNGQAAVALASRFESVIALDASAQQVANATPHERVEYRVARAEDTGIENSSVDLVTVAQALHWLDHRRFFAEASRILRPRGVLAAWGYSNATVSPDFDVELIDFYTRIVGPYWPPERVIVEARYAPVVLPFDEIAAPPFALEQDMNREGFAGYVGTWSAVQRYRQAVGQDPLPLIQAAIDRCWPTPDTIRRVRWPLFLRVGRKPR